VLFFYGAVASRRRTRQPFGEREHGYGGQQQRGRNAHQAQPPSAHPPRVVGVHVGLVAEVRVQAGAQGAQQEPERRAEYADADGDGEVQRGLATGYVVIDERYSQRVDGRLTDAHAQQTGEEYDQYDLRVPGLFQLFGQFVLFAHLVLDQRLRTGLSVSEFRGHAHVGRVIVGQVGGVAFGPGESAAAHIGRRRILMVAEQEVRRRARERGHAEQHHAGRYPPGPVSLAAVVREQQRRTDLSDFGGAEHQSHGLALQLEQLLQRGDDAHEIRGEHSLQHPAEAERGQEHLLGREHLHPLGPARPDAALHVAVVVVVASVHDGNVTVADHGGGQHGVRSLLVVGRRPGSALERGHFSLRTRHCSSGPRLLHRRRRVRLTVLHCSGPPCLQKTKSEKCKSVKADRLPNIIWGGKRPIS